MFSDVKPKTWLQRRDRVSRQTEKRGAIRNNPEAVTSADVFGHKAPKLLISLPAAQPTQPFSAGKGSAKRPNPSCSEAPAMVRTD